MLKPAAPKRALRSTMKFSDAQIIIAMLRKLVNLSAAGRQFRSAEGASHKGKSRCI